MTYTTFHRNSTPGARLRGYGLLLLGVSGGMAACNETQTVYLTASAGVAESDGTSQGPGGGPAGEDDPTGDSTPTSGATDGNDDDGSSGTPSNPCAEGQIRCGDACIAGTECPTTGECPVSPGVLSNFEDLALTVLPQAEGWTGQWEAFGDAAGTQTIAVEASGGTECDAYALHTTGSGFAEYSGISVSLRGTGAAPEIYDASRWTGIRFRARTGSQDTTPVRFNLSTPWTEGTDSGGTCTADCYNHIGRFLYEDNALTNEWKTFTFCFDRDYYPLFLPSNLTTQQRRTIAGNVLKLQFQFNKAKNIPALPESGTNYPEYAASSPYDLWVDDIEFVDEPCEGTTYASAPGTNRAFPQNASLGTCAPATDAANFNVAISRLYEHWKATFVVSAGGGVRVNSPEQGYTPSEAMGYGMMIAAAMGDRQAFDGMWTYTQSQLQNGLMRWNPSGSGSATDADEDIAFALLMAQQQWGGSYQSAAATMIGNIRTQDIRNNNVGPGSTYNTPDAFNPSYVTPSYYPLFQAVDGASWGTVRTNAYNTLSQNAQQFNGLFTDWCNMSNGQPRQAGDFGAQVTGGFNQPVYGYDGARVPWRLGLDACLNGGTASTLLGNLLGYFAGRYDNGDSIDELVAGWYASGPANGAIDNQVSFIGPVGVGAMAVASRANMRDRAFRAVLDILENPEFNRTYYPTTVGLLTLLALTGNFPHP